MAKFTLEIETGNDGMRNGYDVAHVLRDVAYIMQDHGDVCTLGKISKCPLKDINGNTVGFYQVKP